MCTWQLPVLPCRGLVRTPQRALWFCCQRAPHLHCLSCTWPLVRCHACPRSLFLHAVAGCCAPMAARVPEVSSPVTVGGCHDPMAMCIPEVCSHVTVAGCCAPMTVSVPKVCSSVTSHSHGSACPRGLFSCDRRRMSYSHGSTCIPVFRCCLVLPSASAQTTVFVKSLPSECSANYKEFF